MSTLNKKELEILIQENNTIQATNLVKEMGAEGDRELLRIYYGAKSPEVRHQVIEIAAGVRSPSSCEIFLEAISVLDEVVKGHADADNRDLSIMLLQTCAHSEFLSRFRELITTVANVDSRACLALLIGQIGTKDDIELLEMIEKKTPSKTHEFLLARSRLDDQKALDILIGDLRSENSEVILTALQDCLYIRNVALIKYFLPILHDMREMDVTPPAGFVERESVRLADYAVMVMAELGELSSVPPGLKRYSEEEIAMAINVAQQKGGA